MATTRTRLLSGVRVSALVVAELRAAQREGRRLDGRAMEQAARWAVAELWLLGLYGRAFRRKRAAYR